MTSSSQPKLVRALGLFTATLVVTGIIIGSGVFKKIIPLAQTGLSETWILIAWVVAGVITILGALNLSALSSLTEESGGIYEYLRISFGNFFSFLFGWTDFAIIGSASVAALGFIFSQSINSFIPLPNPFEHWQHISIGGFVYPFENSGIKILTIILIVLLTWVNYRGVKGSGLLNNVFTSAKVIGILLLIVLGLFYTAPGAPASIENTAPILQGGTFFSAFFIALLNVFWAYDGWVNISFITGEIKNPKRNVPLAIIIGIAIAMCLYVLINYAYMKVVPLPELSAVSSNEIGAAVVADRMIGPIGQTIITALIMVSVFGTLNGVILSHPRIYYRMAQEKFFFSKVAKVHPVHRTPYIALLYTMVWSCLLALSGTFDVLTDMVIFATFLFYGLLAIAVIKLKRKGIIKAKVIGYPIVQVIILIFALTLIINTIQTHPIQSLIGLGLVMTGVPFYFYWKKKNESTEKKEKVFT